MISKRARVDTVEKEGGRTLLLASRPDLQWQPKISAITNRFAPREACPPTRKGTSSLRRPRAVPFANARYTQRFPPMQVVGIVCFVHGILPTVPARIRTRTASCAPFRSCTVVVVFPRLNAVCGLRERDPVEVFPEALDRVLALRVNEQLSKVGLRVVLVVLEKIIFSV